jgi:hypothetical protein
MGGEQLAQTAHAIAAHEGWVFAREKERVVVEQENPVLDPIDNRLDQDGVVISRDIIEISGDRGFAMNRLCEIAARPRQRLDERRCTQACEIRQRVVAFMPRRAIRAMTVVQEEIFTADDRHVSLFKDFACKGFVGSQRRRCGIVLRIPRAPAGTEMQGLILRANAEKQPRSIVEIAKNKSEFSAGELRIDRLVRIEARLALSKFLQASHAISFDAVTQ